MSNEAAISASSLQPPGSVMRAERTPVLRVELQFGPQELRRVNEMLSEVLTALQNGKSLSEISRSLEQRYLHRATRHPFCVHPSNS